MKYRNCSEYWLDPDTMTFRGEFDEMYLDIQDPWGCEECIDSINKQIFLDILFFKRTYKQILDIGCGRGGFTNRLFLRNGKNVTGFDVSPTAVKKAAQNFPHIAFQVKDILRDKISTGNKNQFDLIVLSEVLWYILEDIDGVFNNIQNAMTKSGILGIHQYFPDVQKFGKEVIDGIDGFESFITQNTNFQFSVKIIYSDEEEGKVLITTLKRRN